MKTKQGFLVVAALVAALAAADEVRLPGADGTHAAVTCAPP